MEIIIHGTKGGYKNSFIPYTAPSFAVGDIRKGSSDENPVGQSAYSIAFENKGYVITQYIITRDTLRSYAVGFIAFSLYLPADKKLPGGGVSILSLLNEVSSWYKQHYIKNNNINCDKTTLIQEDWDFIKEITHKYQEILNENEEQINGIWYATSGIEHPAFIYYSPDKELQKYFDTPFQEEYKKYQQVLFIKAELKDKKENPLHILRNSGHDLTEKIDLNNLAYKIVNQSQSLKSINDVPLSSFNNRIREFDHLRLKWSKDYYSDIVKEIGLSEDNNDPSVSIDHAKHAIIIQEPTKWKPQTKKIKIEVVDYNRNPIKDLPQQEEPSKVHSLKKICKKAKIIIAVCCISLLIGVLCFYNKKQDSSETNSEKKTNIESEEGKPYSTDSLTSNKTLSEVENPTNDIPKPKESLENPEEPREDIDCNNEKAKASQSQEQDQNKEFIARLKKGDITKEEIEQNKNREYKKTFDLYLEILDKVKNSNQEEDFNKILNKIKDDEYLKESELYQFLNDIIKDFDKFKKMRGKKTHESISKLKIEFEKK